MAESWFSHRRAAANFGVSLFIAGWVIEDDLLNLSQHFAVLPLNPWSADVVNSITTAGMSEYTWHGDIF